MATTNHWLGAMRLRTLPLALSSIVAGIAISMERASVELLPAILIVLTTIFLQILSNFANDYGDFKNGADNTERIGPKRAVQSGVISASQMKNAIILLVVLSLVSGFSLLWLTLGNRGLFLEALSLLVIGLGAIAAAIKYTAGKNPYGYKGWGDFFVFLFFGIVGIGGTTFLLAGNITWSDGLLMLTVGCLSTAVLNLNNLRDHINDEKTGKKTLVVKWGFEDGKFYHYVLIITALVSAAMFALLMNNLLFFIPLIVGVILVKNIVFVAKCNVPQALDSELKKVALSAFLYSLILLICVSVSV
ncbi:MAG: 1,4-dihydroxy-2-naphthoate octaprenyltransferase [Flavobacteriales bacterium]